jgi:hypothetical protein
VQAFGLSCSACRDLCWATFRSVKFIKPPRRQYRSSWLLQDETPKPAAADGIYSLQGLF